MFFATTPDGVEIALRLYEPTVPARVTVLALPGIGVPQRAFRRVGSWLSQRGVRLVTVDYRGIGESRTWRGNDTACLVRWACEDATTALNWVQERFGPHVSLLAHSFGGQMLGLEESLHQVDRAVLFGAQLGQRTHWRGIDRLKVEAFWRLVLPLGIALSDPLPRWVVGEVLPRGVARKWLQWALGDDWFFGEFPEARDRFARFSSPLLFCGSSDDFVAPTRAVRARMEQVRPELVQRLELTPRGLGLEKLGHTGFFRPQAEPLWDGWLEFFVDGAWSAANALDSRLPEVAQTQ
jgi:predicted alpha/beta hydrolase